MLGYSGPLHTASYAADLCHGSGTRVGRYHRGGRVIYLSGVWGGYIRRGEAGHTAYVSLHRG